MIITLWCGDKCINIAMGPTSNTDKLPQSTKATWAEPEFRSYAPANFSRPSITQLATPQEYLNLTNLLQHYCHVVAPYKA